MKGVIDRPLVLTYHKGHTGSDASSKNRVGAPWKLVAMLGNDGMDVEDIRKFDGLILDIP